MARNICYRLGGKHITFVVMMAFWALLIGCKEEKEAEYSIGVSQCSQDVWREKMNQEMRREMLFHNDSEIEIVSADDSNEKQIKDIESFIDRGFDLIIVAPNEAEALTPVVKKAYDAGIPVIIFDRRIEGDSYTSYIDLDNKGIGKAAAEYAHSLLGDKSESKVIEVTGLEGSSPARERHEGFVEGLKNFPSLKLASSVSGKWDREKAKQMGDSLLSLYPDIKLAYAHSDNMAVGLKQVFKERGRDDIKILGTDASPGEGIDEVIDGEIDATFIYPTEGHRIIRTAFAILNGEPFERTVHIPALTSVDKSNAEILLRQYELLNDETEKVLLLDSINDNLEKRHTSLSRFLHAVVTLAIILAVVLIITLVMFFRNRKLQKELKLQNKFLEDLLLEKSSNPQNNLSEPVENGSEEHEEPHSAADAGEGEQEEVENSFHQHFLTIIRTQYSNPDLNTEKMAQQMNLGAAQFTRKIKAITRNSPVEILRNYRLEKARKLLLTTDMNVNEITFSVGFSSAAYLTKCFREHFGTTPSELRAAQ